MMEAKREVQILFLAVFAVWFGSTATKAWVWVWGMLNAVDYYTWFRVYDPASKLSAVVGVTAMIVLLIALYRHLRQPRAVPARAVEGPVIALVGAFLSLVPYMLVGPNGSVDNAYQVVVAVSYFSLPLFLFGLGLVFLWEPPTEVVPASLPP